MAKLTTRDRIWSTALELAEEKRASDGWNNKFDHNDVIERLEDPPSGRTIRDTLDSMADLGHLKRAYSGFEPVEVDDA